MINISISWKIATFILLGIAFIVFFALRYYQNGSFVGKPVETVPIPEFQIKQPQKTFSRFTQELDPRFSQNPRVSTKPRMPVELPRVSAERPGIPTELPEEDPFFSSLD
jgi:hypothetical protein